MELRTEGTGNSHTCLPGSRLPTSARASSDPRGQSTALRASSADTPRNVKFIFSVPAPKPLGKTLTGRAPLKRPLQNQAAGAPGQDHVFSGLIQTCNKVREGSCVCTCVCVCVCVCARVQLLSCVQLFATSRTAAHWASLFAEFSRQEYWSGLPFLTPGDLPDPGIEPLSPASPALIRAFFTTQPPRKPKEGSCILGMGLGPTTVHPWAAWLSPLTSTPHLFTPAKAPPTRM